MTLQLKTKARLFDLHCSVGLTDWDMDKELKLATTTDQFYHDDKLSDQYVVQRPSARASRRKDEFIWYDKTSVFQSLQCLHQLPSFNCQSEKRGTEGRDANNRDLLIKTLLHRVTDTFVKPNLWLLVNPNIACPIQYGQTAADQLSLCEHAEEIRTSAETQRPPTHDAPLQEKLLHSVSSTEYLDEDASCRSTKSRRKGRTTKVRDSKTLKPGCWPRPPVNYCILIALALKSSHTGSLKVQQIYNFTREHFPFFQTAPEGWKNTIRHNLCFNSSFRKTCNQLCRDGKRKSCFWHLTLDGQRRLKDEIRMLTGESLKQLERSMSCPGIIQSLLAL